ncbi:MAG: HNH endonuclease signature motif containing protein [Gammaproteobacteria bacterium]|nr:HNH endonuclease signature motif containing protein [Gammaproteobacteria bacterium]
MKGITVIWPDLHEHEYFPGVDVNDLENLPEFAEVQAWFPDGSLYVYKVSSKHIQKNENEFHLTIIYDGEKNKQLVRYEEFDPGINNIILKKGAKKGHCIWHGDNGTTGKNYSCWETFDLNGNKGRPSAKYYKNKRSGFFRQMILDSDSNQCILSGEKTKEVLDAAHLIPAKNGENDLPFNGITLRCDLHKLFDAGLFKFEKDGRVVISDKRNCLSTRYKKFLEGKVIPAKTYERVKDTIFSIASGP